MKEKAKEIIGLTSYCTVLVMLAFMVFCIFYACVFGSFPEIVEVQEGDPQEIDSCELQEINTPNFRGIWCIASLPVHDNVDVIWKGTTVSWIKNGEEVQPLMQVIREVVSTYVTFDSMLVIDKTSVSNGMMHLDFSCFFRHPSGGNWSVYGANFIRVKWYDGYNTQIGLGRMDDRNIHIGSLANDSQAEVIDIIHALPSWRSFNMRYTNLDSVNVDGIWQALLLNCKSGATVDTTGLPISQDRIDQFIYQNIILQ